MRAGAVVGQQEMMGRMLAEKYGGLGSLIQLSVTSNSPQVRHKTLPSTDREEAAVSSLNAVSSPSDGHLNCGILLVGIQNLL